MLILMSTSKQRKINEEKQKQNLFLFPFKFFIVIFLSIFDKIRIIKTIPKAKYERKKIIISISFFSKNSTIQSQIPNFSYCIHLIN